jgi:gluconolactonase
MKIPSVVEKVAGGFQFTEGPVWVEARRELIFSDIPANRLYRFKAGKAEVWREPSGNANGNTLDLAGRLLTCEHGNRRVSRTELDGTVISLAERYQGRRLNSPNDIVVHSDGSIFFSDPPYGVKPEQRELDIQGVYRIDPGSSEPLLAVEDFVKPNGLVFSPDEERLYIADTELDHVRVFQVQPDGALLGGDVFCKVSRPDGMAVDSAGNLYVAAQTAVAVFDADGYSLGEIPVPERPANLTFGDDDARTLYICAKTSLYRVRFAP